MADDRRTTRDLTVSDSVVVAADAETIWAQVADPTQMGRWSPENTGAVNTGAGAARPLSVGDVFVGRNRRGRLRWHTECVVTESEPGRRFAFRVGRIGVRRPLLRGPIATWGYTFEPVDGAPGSTRVTETWHDDRTGWPDAVAAVFDKAATGGQLFADFQRRNIAKTLATLKTDLEGSSGPT